MFSAKIGNFIALLGIGAVLVSCSCKKCNIDECCSAKASEGPGSAADFKNNIPNTVYFGFDRFDLTNEAQNSLKLAADWLKTYSAYNICIKGHTDKRGTQDYNLALGSRRAEATKDYLVKSGVDASRISTISMGKEALVALGDTEEDHALNRRSEISVDEPTCEHGCCKAQ